MPDPLTQIVALLQPSAAFSKLVTATSPFAVSPPPGSPFYAALLEGELDLRVAGEDAIRLGAGDFLLVPASTRFTAASPVPPPGGAAMDPAEIRPGVFHLGGPARPDTRMLIGHCAFGAPDAALLLSLLPQLVVVRGEPRLTVLVEMLSEETRADRPGRDAVLPRLLEVLLIEAFRANGGPAAVPGLVRGLADARLAAALRRMHDEPRRPWTVDRLAREARLSRSTFFERFRREVGVAPMTYLQTWRMALAKDLLRDRRLVLAEIAERVGYGSPGTFSVAFTRSTGTSPAAYARQHARAVA